MPEWPGLRTSWPKRRQPRACKKRPGLPSRTPGIQRANRKGDSPANPAFSWFPALLLQIGARRFTAYKRPKYIEFRNDLPKSNVGKILRRELRDVKAATAA